MKNLEGSARISSQNHLLDLLTTEFQDAPLAYELFDEFLRQRTYSPAFCLKLFEVATQRAETSWDIRRLASLMIEHQILKLDPSGLGNFDFLFTLLNLKQASGVGRTIAGSVLKEGYSTTDFHAFIPEFRRKLERLNRVHNQIKGRRTSPAAVREFIELSRRDCKLTIARYLFTPDEVVEEILRQLQVTSGVRDMDVSQPPFIDNEIRQAINQLPDFEAGILRGLGRKSKIYWVSEATSSTLNSLVEYPLTTVVLVIKPPGSHIEFELKRAGRKSDNALGVAFARNGYTVPPSHRLDGGSMQWLLRYEATHASRLNAIYRLVHGMAAPIASYICRTTIYSVPVHGTEVQTIKYLTEPRVFGKGFAEMRAAMKEAVAALTDEEGVNLPEFPGDRALTAEFLSHVAPAQAILCGTTSFRLDKLAAYLAVDGPERYFKEGLGVEYDDQDAKRLADELIEEVLAVYVPPDVRYKSYGQYLKAAFSVAENRGQANHVFLSLVRQIANFWGTLLALRGHSRGESFVARNVGLRSVWEDGRWLVRIIFMDHDALSFPELHNGHFFARAAVPSMVFDERHIWGGANPDLFSTSDVGYLQNIYRVGSSLALKGQSLAEEELKAAYRKTQQELLTNRGLRSFFSEVFIGRLFDWDNFVGGYLRGRNDPAMNRTWEKEMKQMLAAKGYEPDTFDYYLETVENNKAFLERIAFLFPVAEVESTNRKQAATKCMS